MLDNNFELFFQANERRIHYQIHRLGVSGDWYEEFYSEGMVALWHAYREYDTKKISIGTFLNYRIRFRLIDLLRKKLRDQKAKEVIVREQGVGLVDGNQHRASGMPILDAQGIDLADDAFWQEVRGRLTENQWKWVHYFIISDLTVKEIMELEGVTADAVKGWGRAVREKLRDSELREVLEGLM